MRVTSFAEYLNCRKLESKENRDIHVTQYVPNIFYEIFS